MRRQKNNGFTLLELLVVIAIITMAVGVTVANFRGVSPGAQLKSETRKLVSVLRKTRVTAMSESMILTVIGDAEDNAYKVLPDEETYLLPEGFSLSISVANSEAGLLPDEVSFYPDGTSSGGIFLMSSAAGTAEIDVNWLTGEVALVEAQP